MEERVVVWRDVLYWSRKELGFLHRASWNAWLVLEREIWSDTWSGRVESHTGDQCKRDIVAIRCWGIDRFDCTDFHMKTNISLKHWRSIRSTVFTSVLRAGKDIMNEIGRLKRETECRLKLINVSNLPREKHEWDRSWSRPMGDLWPRSYDDLLAWHRWYDEREISSSLRALCHTGMENSRAWNYHFHWLFKKQLWRISGSSLSLSRCNLRNTFGRRWNRGVPTLWKLCFKLLSLCRHWLLFGVCGAFA